MFRTDSPSWSAFGAVVDAFAHGIQVLRSRHLDRARDLSEWAVTPLGHDRHLVEATDLDSWFAHETPDPDLLTKARHDFGAMILTEEIARANPPPWWPTER
jgi:hypothetical protein